jgi:hypothetical protein
MITMPVAEGFQKVALQGLKIVSYSSQHVRWSEIPETAKFAPVHLGKMSL